MRTHRDPDCRYRLTEVAAAPPGVPGPFRLISASPARIVAERNGVRVELRKLEPFRALRLFRAGKLDEAPVPLGDIRATKLDPQLAPALRVRRLLAADAVIFAGRSRASCASVYDDTADRADYQALVPEFEAPPAEDPRRPRQAERLAGRDRAARREAADPVAAQASPSASRPASDPTLAYGTNLLVAAWRDLGLGAVTCGGDDAQLERLAARVPEALRR